MTPVRRKLLSVLLVVGLILPSAGTAATFWGTEAKGMAGAYTAAAGGFSGISYNPASSASVTNYEFASNFTRLSQNSLDVNNGSVGLGFGVGTVTQGFAVNRTAIDFEFENFDVTSEGLNLDYDDNVFYYNASVQPVSSVRFGANAKYFQVNSSVEDASATGYGLDLGYQQLLTRRLILGVSAINLGASRDWETGLSEEVPRQIRAGLRARPTQELSVEINGVHDENAGLESILLGGEWWIVRRLPNADNTLLGAALRTGVEVQRVGAESVNFSLGMSFKMGFGEVHYSFQEQSEFENQQQFGMTVRFGAPSY